MPTHNGFESLETRRLMSTTPIVINGTNGNDTITVAFESIPAPVLTQARAITRAFRVTGSIFGTPSPRTVITVNGQTSVVNIDPSQPVTINGLDGADRITVTGYHGVTIFGGRLNDPLVGTKDSTDTLSGGDGPDFIDGGFFSDQIKGNGGNDTLHGGGREDTVSGGSGNDQIFGDESNDTLNGDGGNDTLVGGDNSGLLVGGWGSDVLRDGRVDYSGSTARITLTDDGVANDGPAGENDNIGNLNEIRTGSGNDYINVEHSQFNCDIFSGAGNDLIVGTTQDDEINSGSGDDCVIALAGKDTINGGIGDDLLYGNEGDDWIVASDKTGHDTIFAGTGNNTIICDGIDKIVPGGGHDDVL
jgi:Ca2+-binding RTX toxin-like protein